MLFEMTFRFADLPTFKNNQGNQDSSENQKNVIKGQRPNMENIHTHNKEHNITKIMRTKQQKCSYSDSNKTGSMDQVHR